MKKIVVAFGVVCIAAGSVYAQDSASCDAAPPGMVGWWKGDGNGNDNVGADNATVPAGVAYTPGEVALGFNLNGNYDDTNRILVPDAPQLNFGPNKDFSVEAWIQPLSNPGNYTDLSGEVMTVVGKRYAPSFYTAWGYEMYLGNGRLCFQMIDSLNNGGNYYDLAAEPDLRDGEFHHVAVTVQRNSTTGLRFYVDGQLVATFDPTAVRGDLSSTSPLRIGNHPTPGVKAFYHGVIDEVSLYNRALSSNEIAAIYEADDAGKCPVPPTILVQPTNQTVALGGTATFRVSAYGTPPLFYQWSFNGTYIPGATNTSLTLTNVQPAQAGRYAVWVAIPYGSIISSNAVLTVLGATSCDPAPSGLVSWWQAEGNANDSAGINNGTLLGGLGFASGKVGQAFLFNNTNAEVRIPASSSLNVGAGGGLTIEGWINPSSISSDPVLIAEWNNGSWWGSHFAMTSYSGVGTLYANLADTSGNWHQIWTSSGVVTSNAFQHVGLTYDKASGVATLYLNGRAVAQQSLGSFTPQTSYDLYLGRRIAGDFIGGCFAGLMDELSLYNRALSSNEIEAIYGAGSAGKCAPSPTPPVIITQPTNQMVMVGGTATFAVVAAGSAPLNYQWKRNGTNILGATNVTLTLANVQPANAGSYSVVVANAYGSTNSANAVLTVNMPSSCDPAPSGLVAWWQGEGNANDSAGVNNGMLTNGVTYATGTVGRAFSFNGVNQYIYVPRSTSLNSFSNQLTLEFWMYANPSNLMNTYQGLVTSDYYGVEISDGYGGNVGINWYINTTTGEHLISTVNGGGIPVSRGQWHHIAGTYDGAKLQLYVDGLPSGNAQTATGTILPMLTTSFVAIGSDDGRSYCNCTGRYFWGLIDEPSIYRRALSANEITAIYSAGSAGKCPPSPTPPVIVSQPTNQTVSVGGTATFTVVASGSPPLNYQWKKNGTNILVATNATLTLNNVQLTQAGNYSVLVANSAGSTNSANAVLTVNSASPGVPVITGFSPAFGMAGISVRISGTNFSPVAASNTVYFGAVRAVVSAASTTNLVVSVPAGATYAPISETVRGLTAYANAPFLPTFSGSGILTNSSLGPQIILPAGSGPGKVVIADFDGDGKPDLAVNNGGDHTVYIYRNISLNGTLTAGSFAPAMILPLGTGGDTWMSVADLDGDGKLDLVLLDYSANQVMVLQNFCTPGNITTNSFGPRVNFAVGSAPRGVAVQDLDGDGKPEIVTANWGDGTISVLRNIGTSGIITTSSFAPAVNLGGATSPVSAAIADLDGDGKPDVVTVNEVNSNDRGVSVFRNVSTLGNIAFAPRVDFTGPINCYNLAIGDMDGDGKLDVVFSSFATGQSVSVYRNISTLGSFTTNSFPPRVDFGLGGWGNGVALGDLDGNGKPDVAAVTQASSKLSVFRNISTPGSFTNTSLAGRLDFATGSNPIGVSIGDLDGDGRPDIALANNYNGTISIYQNIVPIGGLPSCDPAPSGLVGWWKGEGNGNDSAGSDNATVPSGINYVPGEAGLGFNLNGNTNRILVPDAPRLNFGSNQDFSIEAWIQPLSNPGNYTDLSGEVMTVISKRYAPDFSTALGYEMYLGGGRLCFQMIDSLNNGGNYYNLGAESDLRDGKFHHVAVAVQRSSTTGLRFYVDGQLIATFDPTAVLGDLSNTWPLRIGNHPTTNLPAFYRGIIDEVSLYNRALSSNEIAAIYGAGSAGKCFTATPPVIITQPTNQTVTVGGTATFTVVAGGSAPLNYQWKRNGTNILVATNATLTLNNVQLTQAGNYSVLVANSAGSTNSATAVLTVNTPPSSVPVITGFSPASGMTGISVRISGTNFSPVAASNTVYFGAVRAVVSAASATNLVVSVPAGATYAPISETVRGLTAYANAPFLPTFSGSGILTNSSLGPQIILPTGSSPGKVVIADFDGDGKPDLAVNNGSDHTVYIYRNISLNGTLTAGSFAPPVILPLGTGGEYDMDAADLDRDGRLDLVLIDNSANAVIVLQNLCTPGGITTNSFGPRVNFTVGSNPQGIAVLDLDGDGKPEIVAANQVSSTISVLRNLGPAGSITTNSFAPAVNFAGGAGTEQVAFADLDGDGKPDVVTVNFTNSNNGIVSVFLNISVPGNIAFGSRMDLPGPAYGYNLAIGDLDGDGKSDIVFVSFANGQSVSVYRNISTPGNPTFAPRTDFGLGGWGNGVALGDLDGDGKPDVAAVTQASSKLSVFRNISAPGGFTNTSLAGRLDFASGSNPFGVSIGDLDGDGRPDVAFANNYNGTISIYQNIVPIGGLPSCDPAPSGLVSWWQAGGNANDSIGTNNGTLIGGVTYTNGEAGQAFSLDGTSGFVLVPASPSLNVGLSNGFTIEGWINPATTATPQPIVEWTTGGNIGVHFWVSADNFGFLKVGSLYANVVDTSGGYHSFSSGPGILVSNQFQHVALTYDKSSGMGRLYQNGLVVTQQNLGIFTPKTSLNLNLGNRPGTAYFWSGLLDEISLYSRALSSNEIAAIYNAGSAGKCPLLTNHVSGTVTLPSQPTLATLKTGANLQLTWPISAGTFHVQSADTPLGPWTDVAYTVSTNGESAIVTVTATNQQQYFRLVGQ